MYISAFVLALFAHENTSDLQKLQLACTRPSPYPNKPQGEGTL